MSDTYLLVLTEYLINFMRVLRDGGDTPIDFEELA
jgi:calcium-dependent protein kinase